MTEDEVAQLKAEGNALFQDQKFLAAAAVYTKAVKLQPDNAVLYSNRSAALLKLQKVGKAMEDAEKCIALRPDWDKGYFRKGSVLEAQEAFTEALAAFQTALKLNPDNKELSQKIRTLTKLLDKSQKQQQVVKAVDKKEEVKTATAETRAPSAEAVPARTQDDDIEYEDLGSEAVAKFTEEYLTNLAAVIDESGPNFMPEVHFLKGKGAPTTDEYQEHVHGAGAWEAPEMLQGFVTYLQACARQLEAEAVITLVPKSAIRFPMVWEKPKWPCGNKPGVFALLESRQVYKCWFITLTGPPWKPGETTSLDPDLFAPIPRRLLAPL